MSDQTDTCSSLLTQYGISAEESRIYLYLLEKRPQPALAISRALRIGRTKVYRIVDKLIERGLVVQKLGELGIIFDASDPQVLNQLVGVRRHEVEAIAAATPDVIARLSELIPQGTGSGTKVRYYTGREGLKQVTHHSLSARGHLCIYEAVNDMSNFIDSEHAEWVRERLVLERIKTYQLTNLSSIKPYTKIEKKVTDYWEVRHVPPEKLAIRIETLIYNNIYTLYSVTKNEMFCIEIQNDLLASMQQQLFWYIWGTASPMTITDTHGSAVLASK